MTRLHPDDIKAIASEVARLISGQSVQVGRDVSAEARAAVALMSAKKMAKKQGRAA